MSPSSLDLPPIITIEDVREELGSVVICDTRAYLDEREGRDAYDTGHIPGAVFLDLDTVLAGPPGPRVGRHPLPAPDVFAAALGAAGIDHATKVVAYDDAAGMIASRLVWMLRTLGQAAAILDGGISAWDGPLETEAPAVEAVPHAPRPWPRSATVDDQQVDAIVALGGLVIDSRGKDRYDGLVEPIDPVAGHVPGAINLPFADNLVDGHFRSPDELGERFSSIGADDSTVYYCGSGVSACHNMLAAEAAGLGRGLLYVGSWSGYCTRDDATTS